jgi:hypothetical protein
MIEWSDKMEAPPEQAGAGGTRAPLLPLAEEPLARRRCERVALVERGLNARLARACASVHTLPSRSAHGGLRARQDFDRAAGCLLGADWYWLPVALTISRKGGRAGRSRSRPAVSGERGPGSRVSAARGLEIALLLSLPVGGAIGLLSRACRGRGWHGHEPPRFASLS